MATFDYANPQASLAWLMQPNPLPEQDTMAAEAAIAAGGMVGSPFAQNNRLRLRDSERIQRLALGQNLLQPYLNRAHESQMQAAQIAAESARQAVSESGLDRRLSSSQQHALQQAILEGNQAMQRAILSEAGASSRQHEQIDATSRNLTETLQQRNFEALLPYQQQRYYDKLARIGPSPSRPKWEVLSGPSPVTASGTPTRPPTGTRSTGATLGVVDNILAQYGIGGNSGGGSRGPGFNIGFNAAPDYAPPSVPDWTQPGNVDVGNYFTPQNEFAWSRIADPDVTAMQNYYE